MGEEQDPRIEDLERERDQLEHDVFDAEQDRDEAQRRLEALVRALDDSEDLADALAAAEQLLGYAPVGTYWPSWTQR